MIGNKAIFKQKYFLLYEILYINTFSVIEMNKNQKIKKKKTILDISIYGYRFEVTKNEIQNGCILMATFVLNIYIRKENRITTLLHFLEGNDVMMVHTITENPYNAYLTLSILNVLIKDNVLFIPKYCQFSP